MADVYDTRNENINPFMSGGRQTVDQVRSKHHDAQQPLVSVTQLDSENVHKYFSEAHFQSPIFGRNRKGKGPEGSKEPGQGDYDYTKPSKRDKLNKRTFSFRSNTETDDDKGALSESSTSIFHKREEPGNSHADSSASGDKRVQTEITKSATKKYSLESRSSSFYILNKAIHMYQDTLFLVRNQQTKGVKENLDKESGAWQIRDKKETIQEYQNENFLSALHRDYYYSRLKSIIQFRSFRKALKLLNAGDRSAAINELRNVPKELTAQGPQPHIVTTDGTIQFHAIKTNLDYRFTSGVEQSPKLSPVEYTLNINIDNISGLNRNKYIFYENMQNIPVNTYDITYKDSKREQYAIKMAREKTGIESEEEAKKYRDAGSESSNKIGMEFLKEYDKALKVYGDLENDIMQFLPSSTRKHVATGVINELNLSHNEDTLNTAIVKFSIFRGNEDTLLTEQIIKFRYASYQEREAEEQLIIAQANLMREREKPSLLNFSQLEQEVKNKMADYTESISRAELTCKRFCEFMGLDKEQAKAKYLLKDRILTRADHDNIEIYHHDDGSAHTGIRINVDKIDFAASKKVVTSSRTAYELHFKDGLVLDTSKAVDIGEMVRTAGRKVYNEYVDLNKKRVADLIELIEKKPSRANKAAINLAITTIIKESKVQHVILRFMSSFAPPTSDDILVPQILAIQELKDKSFDAVIEMNSRELTGSLGILDTKRENITSKILSIAKTNPEARKIVETNDALTHPFGENNITTRTDLMYETAGAFLQKTIGDVPSQKYLSDLLQKRGPQANRQIIQDHIHEAYFEHEGTSLARQGAVYNILHQYGMERLIATKIASTVINEMDQSFSNWLASTITVPEKNRYTNREKNVDVSIQNYLDAKNISEASARKMFYGAAQDYLKLPSNTSFETLNHYFDLDYENQNKQVANSMTAKMTENINSSQAAILNTDINLPQRKIAKNHGNIQSLFEKQKLSTDVFDLEALKILKDASRPRAYISSMRVEMIPKASEAYLSHSAGSPEAHHAMYDVFRQYGVGHLLANELVTILSRELEGSRNAFWNAGQVVTAKEFMDSKNIGLPDIIKKIFDDIPSYPNVRAWLSSPITIDGEETTKRRFLKKQGVEESEAKSLFLLRSTVDDNASDETWWDKKIPSSTDKNKLQVMRKRYHAFRGIHPEIAEKLHKGIRRKSFKQWSAERVPFNGRNREKYLALNGLNEARANHIYNIASASDQILKGKVSAEGMVRKEYLKDNDIVEEGAKRIYNIVHNLNDDTPRLNYDGWLKTEMHDSEGKPLGTVKSFLDQRGYSEEALHRLFTSIDQATDFKSWFESKVGRHKEEETVKKEGQTVKREEQLKNNGIPQDGATIIYSTVPKPDKDAPGVDENTPRLNYDGWLKTEMHDSEGKPLGTVKSFLDQRGYSKEAMQSLFTSIDQATDFKSWFGGEVRGEMVEEIIWKEVSRDTGEQVSREAQLKAKGLSTEDMPGFIKSRHQAKKQEDWLEKDIVVGGKTMKVKSFLAEKGLSDDLYYDIPPSSLKAWKETKVLLSDNTFSTVEGFLKSIGLAEIEMRELFTSIDQATQFKTWFKGELPEEREGREGREGREELAGLRSIETISREKELEGLGFTKKELPKFFESIEQAAKLEDWLEQDIVVGGKTVKVRDFMEEKGLSTFQTHGTVPKLLYEDWENTTIEIDKEDVTIKDYLNDKFSSETEKREFFDGMVREADHVIWSEKVIELSSVRPLSMKRADLFEARGIDLNSRNHFFKEAVRVHSENFYSFSTSGENLSVGTDRIKEIFSPLPSIPEEGKEPITPKITPEEGKEPITPKITPEEGAELAADLLKKLQLAGQGNRSMADVINRYIGNPKEASKIAENLALEPHEELTLDDTERWLATEPASMYKQIGKLNQLWKNRVTLDVIHYKRQVGIPMRDLTKYFNDLDSIGVEVLEKIPSTPARGTPKAPGQFYANKEEKELIRAEIEFQNHWVTTLQNSYARFYDNQDMEEDMHTAVDHTYNQLAKVDSDRLQVMEIMKDASKTSEQRQKMLEQIDTAVGKPLNVVEADERLTQKARATKTLETLHHAVVFEKDNEERAKIMATMAPKISDCADSLGRVYYQELLIEAVANNDRQRLRELIVGKKVIIDKLVAEIKENIGKGLERTMTIEKARFAADQITKQWTWFVVLSLGTNFNQSMASAQQLVSMLSTRMTAISFKA